MWMEREVHTGFWWENLKKRDHLQELYTDGKIILMDLKECLHLDQDWDQW